MERLMMDDFGAVLPVWAILNQAHARATDLGHPLVAAAKCVRNDVRLSNGKRVFLVSGSNMSGKSTLLRTVGVNAVLAMAGAPVRAQGLRLTPLHVVPASGLTTLCRMEAPAFIRRSLDSVSS